MPANQLIVNDTFVSSLRIAMREGTFGLSNVPDLIKRILRENMWQERTLEQTGEIVLFGCFAEFVTAPPLPGLGTDLATIKRLCHEDKGALILIDEATPGRQGERTDLFDNIQEVEPAPTGTSAQSALRRLRKERPDLLERVVADELSAHAAMIEAGFRKRTLTIPVDVRGAAAALKRHLSADELAELRELL